MELVVRLITGDILGVTISLSGIRVKETKGVRLIIPANNILREIN